MSTKVARALQKLETHFCVTSSSGAFTGLHENSGDFCQVARLSFLILPEVELEKLQADLARLLEVRRLDEGHSCHRERTEIPTPESAASDR